MFESLIERLSTLPLALLYPALAFFAAIENVIPPLPTDAVVAFGSFLAARGHGNPWISFLVTWLGNLAGAAAMYGVGHHYGRSVFHRAMARWGGPRAEHRLATAYDKYGIPALFVSRFLPGVRALVPVFGGAARLPFFPVMGVIAVASGLWYGFLAFIAYRASRDWETLRTTIANYSSVIAAVAVVIAVAAAVVWWRRRRRSTWTPGPATDTHSAEE